MATLCMRGEQLLTSRLRSQQRTVTRYRAFALIALLPLQHRRYQYYSFVHHPLGVLSELCQSLRSQRNSEKMSAVTAQTAPAFQQRLRRFLEEDAATFAACSVFGSSIYAAREYHSDAVTTSTRHRILRALRRTLPIAPAIVLSSAIGIVGMKVTLAAVQDARRDYSRTSVLIAVPLFAALIHAPAGSRAMAKSAVGYGAFILAADFAASEWHHHNAIKLEMEKEEVEADQIDFSLHPASLHFGQLDTHAVKPHPSKEQ